MAYITYRIYIHLCISLPGPEGGRCIVHPSLCYLRRVLLCLCVTKESMCSCGWKVGFVPRTCILLLCIVTALAVNSPNGHNSIGHDKKPVDFITRYTQWIEHERHRFDPNHSSPGFKVLSEGLQKAYLQAASRDEQRKSKTSHRFVQKKVFDNTTRVLFFAGIEGSGHHAMKEVFEQCFSLHLCRSAPFTKDLFYRGSGSFGLFGGNDYFHDDNVEIVYGRMKEFVYNVSHHLPIEDNLAADNVFQRLTTFYDREEQKILNSKATIRDIKSELNETSVIPPHIYVIGLETYPNSGMMSYPNYNDGRSKAVDHPDITQLAILAEAAGIDLRIVVLSRPAYDTLYSAAHRGYGNSEEGSILVDNAKLLAQQVQSLDPSFILCLSYEDLVTYPTKRPHFFSEHLAQFLHPELSALSYESSLRKPFSELSNKTLLLDKMWSKLRPVHHSPATSGNSLTLNAKELNNLRHYRDRRRLASLSYPHKGWTSAQMDEWMKVIHFHVWRLQTVIDDLRASCPVYF